MLMAEKAFQCPLQNWTGQCLQATVLQWNLEAGKGGHAFSQIRLGTLQSPCGRTCSLFVVFLELANSDSLAHCPWSVRCPGVLHEYIHTATLRTDPGDEVAALCVPPSGLASRQLKLPDSKGITYLKQGLRLGCRGEGCYVR